MTWTSGRTTFAVSDRPWDAVAADAFVLSANNRLSLRGASGLAGGAMPIRLAPRVMPQIQAQTMFGLAAVLPGAPERITVCVHGGDAATDAGIRRTIADAWRELAGRG